jgi:AcrR family transcriptional regulator
VLLGFARPMSPPKPPLAPRKRPVQARSRRTVNDILEGAARVFRREGWQATTNRIAAVAGVGVGSLYEYFPNKESLLLALAERHVEVAEQEVARAIEAQSTQALLAALQRAILASQRFPSEALALVRDVPLIGPELLARAEALRAGAIDAITERLRQDRPRGDASVRARAIFGVIGDLTARAMIESPEDHAALAADLLEMAQRHLRHDDRAPDDRE